MKFRAVIKSDNDMEAEELALHPVQGLHRNYAAALEWSKKFLEGHPHRFVLIYECREMLVQSVTWEK
jgi:hypothetical protein